jgi:hypothetical protein
MDAQQNTNTFIRWNIGRQGAAIFQIVQRTSEPNFNTLILLRAFISTLITGLQREMLRRFMLRDRKTGQVTLKSSTKESKKAKTVYILFSIHWQLQCQRIILDYPCITT